MDDREFWARAFLSSKSWKADGDAFNASRAHRAAEMADAALLEYRKRFGAEPAEPKSKTPSNVMVRLEMERETNDGGEPS